MQVFDRLPDIGERSRCPEIEEVFEQAKFWEKLADTGPATYVGDCFALQGRYGEAESVYRRALVADERAQKARGVNNPGRNSAILMSKIAVLLDAEGRAAESTPLFRRALAIEELFGTDRTETATALNNLAIAMHDQGEDIEAEPLLRRALSIREKALGGDNAETANSLDALGVSILAQGHLKEAETLFRRAVEINEKALGATTGATATSLSNLGFSLFLQGEYQDADPIFDRALSIRMTVLRAQHPDTLGLRENIARNFAAQRKFGEAVAEFRLACAGRTASGSGHNLMGDAAQAARRRISRCSTDFSLALWAWAASGGGTGPGDQPFSLMGEAFLASQSAATSAAAEAIARSASLAAAQSAGIGDQALAYESALMDKQSIDLQFAVLEGEAGKNTIESRQSLEKASEEVNHRTAALAEAVKNGSPRYWNYRNPSPVSLVELQTPSSDSALLHDDEALLSFLIPPDDTEGLVFAVSKTDAAWAKVKMTGPVLKDLVERLRAQVDPHGYELRGLSHPESFHPGRADANGFDRQAAYELYAALLGNPDIQRVISEKSALLFVPNGPLTSLPPALLIATPPRGGVAKDSDPAALRQSDWLLRSKAVALMPSVSGLKAVRQSFSGHLATTPDPLLAFADPELTPAAHPPGTDTEATRDGANIASGSRPSLAEALERLPPLPGTRMEGEALRRALGARSGSVLEGKEANKIALMSRNLDGRLSKVRVLAFATHGLMAGDAADLTEPALVLGSASRPEDEVLLASEAAGLSINADWVLLSACNTASPGGDTSDGLSGLTRAFFYAGGRALLVSHWRIRDDIAKVLVPRIILSQQQDATLSNAQALRLASLAIMDDPALDAANPRDWAPFTLVGDAGH